MRPIEHPDLPQRLAHADASKWPDVHSLKRVRAQALWVLMAAKDACQVEPLRPATIGRVLRDAMHISVTDDAIIKALSKARGLVIPRRAKRALRYAISEKGRQLVLGAGNAVTVIDPGKPFGAQTAFAALLRELGGALSVCDPYLHPETLEVLEGAGRASGIRLLTVNVSKPGQMRQLVSAFSKQVGPLQVRISDRRDLHDRYIIAEARMLLLGCSLNGIGKKQAFVVEVGRDMRALVLASFDTMWQTATPL